MHKLTLLAILFSGCSALPIHPKELDQLVEFCKGHGGWVELRTAVFDMVGRCHDGTFVPSKELIK